MFSKWNNIWEARFTVSVGCSIIRTQVSAELRKNIKDACNGDHGRWIQLGDLQWWDDLVDGGNISDDRGCFAVSDVNGYEEDQSKKEVTERVGEYRAMCNISNIITLIFINVFDSRHKNI